MTGMPLELTPLGAMLGAIGWIYWFLVAAGLWWAVATGQSPSSKMLRALPVVLLFGLVPLREGWTAYRARDKLNQSMALFNERCKSAGETINRVVVNVDGLVLMKWREKAATLNEQFKFDDPYGRDCGLEGCIRQLLRASEGSAEPVQVREQHSQGYRFVETVDPRDGVSYRYSATLKRIDGNRQEYERSVEATGFGGADGSFVALKRTAISAVSARFGVRWDDISTREDREHWIAGGSLKVIDLQTNEVIAQRVGYLIDPGQGSKAGFRSPWGWAKSYAPRCPPVDVKASEFVLRVVRLVEEE